MCDLPLLYVLERFNVQVTLHLYINPQTNLFSIYTLNTYILEPVLRISQTRVVFMLILELTLRIGY